MKKLSILLVLLLILGTLAACKTEDPQTNFPVPGYLVDIPAGEGWAVVEDTRDPTEGPVINPYNLQLVKDGVNMYIIGYSMSDFVDMPSAEDMFLESYDILMSDKSEAAEKAAMSSYTVENKTILTGEYTAKVENDTKTYYVFLVDFGSDTGTYAFVAFEGTEKQISKNKDAFKSIVDGMTCTAKAADMEDPFADEPQFDENGELIVDDPEGEEGTYETTEATEPMETTQATEAPETTGATEASETTGATTAPTTAG